MLDRAVEELPSGIRRITTKLPTRPGHAGWATPTPGAQCLGADHVELAIGSCSSSDLDRYERLEARWEDALADERRGAEVPVGPDGAIAFQAAPGEIVTFRIR